MKKIILSAGVFSLLFAGVLLSTSVLAVGTGSSTKDVVVGEAPDAVYSVDIAWGDFEYDWDNSNYSFKAHVKCAKKGSSYPGILGGYYTDSKCKTEANDIGDNYYSRRGIPAILVIDNSTNGRVKANVAFTPTSSYYSLVSGKFYNNYSINQDRTIQYSDLISDGQITPNMVGELWAYLDLETSNGSSLSDHVYSGEKIGTVTLTISPSTN